MNALFTAIKTKVDELSPSHNSFYTSIGGRFYNTFAPQESPFPYCVMYLINDGDSSTLTEQLDTIILQFTIYSNSEDSASQAGTIYENLKTLFDDSRLTMTGYSFLYMHRQFANLTWIPQEGVWQYLVQYEIKVHKTS